ncbi:PLP-dependent transferase [Amniculicola lignicola CBS 123094]|uniref:PLP-dependent transferase n=1 Tax=Amniculicola lignicola CBS 123094 TaxID=1392246 RepID=A0A6A5W331_9PLEO|nr:PLP-dependent transferase [Amniculicola lignicola CBS 123094]
MTTRTLTINEKKGSAETWESIMEREMEGLEGVKFGKEMRKWFMFEEGYLNLNHGSFGTYPRSVCSVMRHYQELAEARPDDFIRYQYPNLLDGARLAISKVLKAPMEELVFVPNATTGVNTVLRNLAFEDGDHIVYFSTIYGGCEKTVKYVTETTKAKSVKVEYTFPVEDAWLVRAFKEKVQEVQSKGGKVKIALFDTVVSMPGVRMPFEELTKACKELGVLSLVDGAHGVGHIDLDLGKLDADFFVSNCHKWLHVPRGTAIFHVPTRHHPLIRSTLPTSHGFIPLPSPTPIRSPFAASPKSPFVLNFQFVGTIDNAPYLCVPASLAFREKIGGEEKIMKYCSELANVAANRAAQILGTQVLQNETKTLTNCCLTNVKLPLDLAAVVSVTERKGFNAEDVGFEVRDWLGRKLVEDHDTFMAVMFYGGNWWVRFSGQVYLELEDFEWAAGVLKGMCERILRGEFLKGESKL